MIIRFLISTLILGLLPTGSACAQDFPGRESTPRVASRVIETGENEIAFRRSEVARRLAAAIQELQRQQEQNPESGAEPSLSREVDLLNQTKAILAQHQTAVSRKAQLVQRVSELEAESEQLSKASDSPPANISFVVFDQWQNELDSATARLAMAESAVAAEAEGLVTSKNADDKQQAAVRLAKEAVNSNKTPESKADLESALKTRELELELTTATLELRRLNSDIAQLNRQIAKITVQLLEQKLAQNVDRVTFAEAELQEVLVQIERQELEIRQSIKMAESKLQLADREWAAAQLKMDRDGETPQAKEQLTASSVARQLAQLKSDLLNLKMGRLAVVRETWMRRSKVFNSQATNAELSQWAGEVQQSIASLQREKGVRRLESEDVRNEVAALELRLQTLTDDTGEIRKWVNSQLADWREYLQTIDNNLANIDATIQLLTDLLGEIKGDIESWTFAEHLASAWSWVVSFWNTELTNIDDRPITIGKVVIGILLLFVGFFAARIISWILGNRLLSRFGMNEGAAAALKSLSFYSLTVVFSLLALRFANVPLTIFTLLGGALAIGVGFGSQAIINNFISGLILLAERPIQVGDLVRLDDLIGTVTQIGARSTRVRTGDNLDIIVPNSKFLETNVQNFTLNDDKFRSFIKVGLVYGTSTRDATRLLLKAAEDHGLILEHPKPFVWFSDFGDNALVFELHVWIKVRTQGERLRIESDLRYRVDQLFREGGIVIAFPQRDVHLDVDGPIELRMAAGEDSSRTPSTLFGEAARGVAG